MAGQSLLLAATDPNSIYLLRRYAQESGFAILHVGDGEELLPLARRVRPAAIILETGLPGMVDEKALLALKGEDATRAIPVIVYAWASEEADGSTRGVAGYLRHPLLYEDFLRALERVGVRLPIRGEP